MNKRQFELLIEMFTAQTAHVVSTMETMVKDEGVEAAHKSLEDGVKECMILLDEGNDRNGRYEFNLALTLPSLFLAGLYLDLQLEHVEIVRRDENHYSVNDEVFKR